MTNYCDNGVAPLLVDKWPLLTLLSVNCEAVAAGVVESPTGLAVELPGRRFAFSDAKVERVH